MPIIVGLDGLQCRVKTTLMPTKLAIRELAQQSDRTEHCHRHQNQRRSEIKYLCKVTARYHKMKHTRSEVNVTVAKLMLADKTKEGPQHCYDHMASNIVGETN